MPSTGGAVSSLRGEPLLALIQDLGYTLLRQGADEGLGADSLVVGLQEYIGDQDFDLKTMRLAVRDDQGTPRSWTLTWMSPIGSPLRVCPGHVTVASGPGHSAEFLTFGGTLEEITAPDGWWLMADGRWQIAENAETAEGGGKGMKVFLLRSPVPILELATGRDPVADQFAAQMEALLGEADAATGLDDEAFDHRLAEVDPSELYASVVETILQRIKHSDDLKDMYHDLADALTRDRRWRVSMGTWPARVRPVEELLALSVPPTHGEQVPGARLDKENGFRPSPRRPR